MNRNNIVLIAAGLASLASLAGCGSSAGDRLIGAWKTNINPVITLTMDFQQDGTLFVSTKGESQVVPIFNLVPDMYQEYSATWSVTDVDGDALTVQVRPDESDEQVEWTIVLQEDNRFILKDPQQQQPDQTYVRIERLIE